MAVKAFKDEAQNRYVLEDEQGTLLSVVDYRINEDATAFVRTFTPPNQRGHGYAADIVKFAVDDVVENTKNYIVPTCWYVAEWFDKNPDYEAYLKPRD